MLESPREFLLNLFEVAVDAAQPALCLPPHLPDPPDGRIIVIGGGKASAAMAAVAEEHYPGDLSGLVITRYGYAVPCSRIEIVEAAHPLPDEAGHKAASRMLENLSDLSKDDLVLCLISGGGSALLTLPAEGLSLEDKQAVNETLLRSGASIVEINVVRKHLSKIKGGRLARACAPARLHTLVISDVVDDDPSSIASGPTVPDSSTFADALRVVEKYQMTLPVTAMHILNSGLDETPKPGDSIFSNSTAEIIASGRNSLAAAEKVAEASDVTPIIVDEALQGEASSVGREMANVVRQYIGQGPCVLLSGGELTVTVSGSGTGGPNTEFLLGLAQGLNDTPNVYALACDTDGIDGLADNAGAIITPDTLARAQTAGVNLESMLANNDAYGFFTALDDLVVSGPTFTNVNDFRAILITG